MPGDSANTVFCIRYTTWHQDEELLIGTNSDILRRDCKNGRFHSSSGETTVAFTNNAFLEESAVCLFFSESSDLLKFFASQEGQALLEKSTDAMLQELDKLEGVMPWLQTIDQSLFESARQYGTVYDWSARICTILAQTPRETIPMLWETVNSPKQISVWKYVDMTLFLNRCAVEAVTFPCSCIIGQLLE